MYFQKICFASLRKPYKEKFYAEQVKAVSESHLFKQKFRARELKDMLLICPSSVAALAREDTPRYDLE